MSTQHLRSSGARRGFTVLELVVVLTVLAITAAVMIPMFPNFLRRANKAMDATQMGELGKAIQLYYATYFGYPNDMDSFIASDGTMPTYLPGTAAGAYDEIVKPGTLSENAAKALKKVGITRIQQMATATALGTGNATQNPYADASPETDGVLVDTGVTVAVLNTADILSGAKEVNDDLYNILTSDPGATGHPATYVMFGIGSRNSAVGKTMLNAPVAMPQDTALNPVQNYCRYGAIFKVDGNEIALTKRARLVAIVSMEEDEFETIENEVIGYIKAAQGEAGQPATTGDASTGGGTTP